MHPASCQRLNGSRRRQSTGAAAARQAHEHRFCDVVLLMAEPEDARVLFKKSHPRGARRGLAGAEVPTWPRPRHESDAELPARSGAEPRIGVRLRTTQAMVEMQRAQGAPTLRPVGPHEQQEGERIRAARKRHGPTRAPRRSIRPCHHRRVQSLAREDRCETGGDVTQSSGVPCRNTAPAPRGSSRVRRAAGCSQAVRPARAARRGRNR